MRSRRVAVGRVKEISIGTEEVERSSDLVRHKFVHTLCELSKREYCHGDRPLLVEIDNTVSPCT